MIRLHGLRKSYKVHGGVREVLRGVDVTFSRGDAVGILGRNGAGKSTLLRLIAGVERPTAGRVERQMSVSWPLGFGGANHPVLSGADNVRFVARAYGRPVERTVDFVREFSELGEYMRMPVETYSSGMGARLSFAMSLAVDFDCYLVDEVVAAGDSRFTERCRQALLERRGRSALIMVSHSPEILRTFCTTGATLQDGKLHFHEDLDQALATHDAH